MFQIIIRIYLLLVVLLSTVFQLQTNAQQQLVGQWLRVEDDVNNPTDRLGENYDSTIIEVFAVDSVSYIGELIKVPTNAVNHGYARGQIKWKNFQIIKENKYSFDGLLMNIGPTGHFDSPEYIKTIMILKNDDTIILWTVEQSERFGGKKQKWIKIPPL